MNRFYLIKTTTAYETPRHPDTLSQVKADDYTPIAIDMIDNRNQSSDADGSNRPNDQVNGYTLYQLEQALPGNLESWYGWRNNIKSMYSNSTEQHVDYLFSEYLQ